MKANLTITILALIILLFTGCDNGKSSEVDNSNNDIDKIAVDEEADETSDMSDEATDEMVDETPDEDNAPKITISCPEEINEDSGKTLCEVISENNSIVLDSGDTCGGMIETGVESSTYSFTPSESFGPGTCTAKVKDTVSEQTAEAIIKVNEVNNPPSFTSSDFSGFTFYEGVVAKRDFYFTDNDHPNKEEKDPGYAVCSVRDNTCGIELDIVNENGKCSVSGTMQEELSGTDCEFKLVLTDGYGTETVETVSAILSEKNETPVWTEQPVSFEAPANSVYSGINGKASDTDLPKENDGDPGYLNCGLDSDSCSFDITVLTERESDGTVSCKLEFTSNDMETCEVQYKATDGTKSVYSGNIEIKIKPTVEIDCPETVNEEEELVCIITPNGGTPTDATVTDNCYGTIENDNGTWKYKKTFTEFESPKTCNAGVTIGDVTAQDSVSVLEVNNAPVITMSGDCETPESATVTEETDFNCYAGISDVDRPNLITTDPGFISCEITDNTCGTWLTFDDSCNGSGKPDEESGGTTCSYTVKAIDGYSAETTQTIELTINEYNDPPVITESPATQYHLLTGEHIEFTYTANDTDLPNSSDGDAGYLKCSVISDVAQSSVSVTGEGSGPLTCNVEIDAHSSRECDSGCPVTFEIEDGFGSKKSHYSYIYVRKCIFFVKPDGTGTEGRDWTGAFGTVQEAVDRAWSGCDIWVAQGTYTNALKDGSSVLTMKEGVKIIGGFEGYETYDNQIENYRFRPEDPIVHSVLDGENISYHVVTGNVRNTLRDGFIITNGQADGPEAHQKVGGGMYNYDTANTFSAPYVSNCIFTDNYAENDGGAVYNEGFKEPYTEFYNCEFYNNNSGRFGGAAYSKDTANVKYKECEFTGNTSNNGGAIVEYHSGSEVEKCVFTENEAIVIASSGGAGGAIKLTSESAIAIENSIFYKNNAETFGGAIDGSVNDLAIIDHVTFSNNTSTVSGSEAIFGLKGMVQNSIFWNNGVGSSDLGISYSYGSNTTGDGNIESMPSGAGMFVNESGDFHLDPTSPAIDSGHPSHFSDEDIEGQSRPLGEGCDMGAYEHESIAPDYYVDCEAASTGNGSSWTSPFKTFHQAIGQLNSDGKEGVLFVKSGTCSYSTVGMGQDNIIAISDGIKLFGGFTGTETYLRERIDPTTNPTVLDGEHNDVTIIEISGEPEDVIIDGFTIKNGGAGGFSGALKSGSKVANCIFENNSATYGGAMYISGSPYHTLEPSVIVNTSFILNQSSHSLSGGAIYFNHIDSSNVKIVNCNFLLNSVAQLANSGVAIYLYSTASHADIKNSIFYLNRSKYNYTVDQISGIDEATLTDSLIDTDPAFVNAPEYFAVAYDPGTTSRIDLYGIPTGVTDSYLIEINDDGVLRTITSISGASVNFSPETSNPTQGGDTAQFWSSATSSAELDMLLKSSSNCIDNGTFSSESFRDQQGKRRDTDFDIGVYEY